MAFHASYGTAMDSIHLFLYPYTPCMAYVAVNVDGFGGQCRHIWQSHGVFGYRVTSFSKARSETQMIRRRPGRFPRCLGIGEWPRIVRVRRTQTFKWWHRLDLGLLGVRPTAAPSGSGVV